MERRAFVKRTVGIVAAGLVPAGAFTACSDDPEDSGGITDPGSDLVEVRLTSNPFTFDPSEVTVEAGTTVRWMNTDGTFHTVTPEGHDEFPRHVFPADAPDETFEHTFETPGTFPYFCEPHRSLGMEGRIVVQ